MTKFGHKAGIVSVVMQCICGRLAQRWRWQIQKWSFFHLWITNCCLFGMWRILGRSRDKQPSVCSYSIHNKAVWHTQKKKMRSKWGLCSLVNVVFLCFLENPSGLALWKPASCLLLAGCHAWADICLAHNTWMVMHEYVGVWLCAMAVHRYAHGFPQLHTSLHKAEVEGPPRSSFSSHHSCGFESCSHWEAGKSSRCQVLRK